MTSRLFEKDADYIVLSFGGSDPHRLSEKVVEEIGNTSQYFENYKFKLLIGSRSEHVSQLEERIKLLNTDIEIVQNPEKCK